LLCTKLTGSSTTVIHENNPVKTVAIGVSSLKFLTPLVKQSLRRSTRFMSKRRILAAGEIAVKVGELIAESPDGLFADTNSLNPSQLRSAVESLRDEKLTGSFTVHL
jgi:hypothetical protein